MGNCCYCCICCLSEEEREAVAINKAINLVLAEENKIIGRQIKLLLLGTAESGKSTFIKQMIIIHGRGYSEDQRREYTHLVYQNIIQSVNAMIYAMKNLEIPFSNPQNEIYAQCFRDLDIHQITQLQRSYVDAIHHLWADEGFMECYKHKREYQLDSAKYFIDNLERIAAKDYIPTHQDVLRVHKPSTGITEYSISIQKIIFRIVDVGGQRSERRKWIHCFENVTSVIFVASLSEYDQVLIENSSINRMEESLSLFNTTIHSPWFANSSIILYLNKMDILAEKIQFSDLKTYFPEFEGRRGDDHDAMMFIRKLYTQKIVSYEEKNSKSIYSHFICVTDTTETRKLFNDMKDFIIMEILNDYKML